MAFAAENLVSGTCFSDIKVLRASLGATAQFDLTIIDRVTGLPRDMTAGGTVPVGDLSVRLVATHVWDSTNVVFAVDGIIVDATIGSVSFSLVQADLGRPGIYTATLGTYIDDTAVPPNAILNYTQPYYIEIEGTDIFKNPGPPTIAEIRLHLRDTCPESNFLIDEVEFGDGEIAACLRLPVDQFNETLPPIDPTFNVDSFPFRYNWIRATVGLLHSIGAAHYRRNRLAYQTGGVSVDPEGDKAQMYEQIARERAAEYAAWVDQKKLSLNASGGYAILDSPYSFT